MQDLLIVALGFGNLMLSIGYWVGFQTGERGAPHQEEHGGLLASQGDTDWHPPRAAVA